MHSSTDIPDQEPTEVTQGNTVQWTRDLSSHYSPSTWTLKYYLTGPIPVETIVATTSGNEFAVTVAAAATALWTPGRYRLDGFITSAALRYGVYEGLLDVEIDPSTIQAGTDMRSWARICYDNLKAAVQGTSDSFILNYSIGGAGRTIGKMSAQERMAWLDYFAAKVLREEQQAKADRGEATGRDIYIRFT